MLTSRRSLLTLAALSLGAATSGAQEPRFTLGVLAAGAMRANQTHLSDGQLGVQGSVLARRMGRVTLRVEGRVTDFAEVDDPRAIWCFCDRRQVGMLGAVGVGATVQLARARTVPYAIASASWYGTVWEGGVDESGPPVPGVNLAEVSGIGPEGVLLSAGLGWRLGGGRTPLRLELRHESYARQAAEPAYFLSGSIAIGW